MTNETIRERANKEYRRKRDSSGDEGEAYAHFNGCFLGAKEQRIIDIEKAWGWIMNAIAIPESEVLAAKESFLKSMED